MTKILDIVDTIKTQQDDPVYLYLPAILFILIVVLNESLKYSKSFRRFVKEILPIDDSRHVLIKSMFIALTIYYIILSPVYGVACFILVMVYLQSETVFDEWSKREVRDAYKKTKQTAQTQSLAQIRKQIATINSEEIPPREPIPKRIIQLWVDKTPVKRLPNAPKYPDKFLPYTQSIREMNPDYEYMFFDGPGVESFLKTEYPDYYDTYKRLPAFIQKLDFFRYVALYHYGGFYMDLDVHAFKPLDDSVRNHKSVFPVDEYIVSETQHLRRYRRFHANGIDFLFGQYAFGCVPKNGFVKKLVDTIHTNISHYERLLQPGEQYVYSTTGPDFVTDEYAEYAEKEDIFVLDNGKRQFFGNYAQHDYAGTWK